MFEFDAADFDKRAVEADEVLRKAKVRAHQSAAEPERVPLSHGMTDAQIIRMVDQRIAAGINFALHGDGSDANPGVITELLDDVGDCIGELLKEIDADVRGLISRIVDIEVQAKHRADAVSKDMVVQMKHISETLADVSAKIDAARSGGENIVALRKVN